MYNQLFGVNPHTKIILHELGLEYQDIERFRDCGVNYKEKFIWIYTRTGGKNAKDFPNKILTENKYYIAHGNDLFDSTYAIYHFKVSDENFDVLEYCGIKPSNPVDWAEYFRTFDPEKEAKKMPELMNFLMGTNK